MFEVTLQEFIRRTKNLPPEEIEKKVNRMGYSSREWIDIHRACMHYHLKMAAARRAVETAISLDDFIRAFKIAGDQELRVKVIDKITKFKFANAANVEALLKSPSTLLRSLGWYFNFRRRLLNWG